MKPISQTLREKIEDARLSKNEWLKSSCCDTWRYWEGKLEAYQYCLDLVNFAKANQGASFE